MKAMAKHVDPERYRRRGKRGYAATAALGFVAGFAAYQAKKMAVQGVTSARGDWVETLKTEHRMVEALFEKLLATSEEETLKRTTILTAIAHALSKHALAEENIVYPELRTGNHEAEAVHLFTDHADIKTFIHELEELPKDSHLWLPKAQAFFELIQRHVAEEEVLLPTFRDSLSPEANTRIALQIYREGVKLA
jgi:hypothetical protein